MEVLARGSISPHRSSLYTAEYSTVLPTLQVLSQFHIVQDEVLQDFLDRGGSATVAWADAS